MRLVVAALAFGLAAPAAAQTLAPTEVLLEVNAAGTVTSRADLATYRLSIEVHGDSAGEARSLMADRIRRLTAAATSVGVAAADIEPGPVRVETLSALDVADVPEELADAAAAVQPPPSPPPLQASTSSATATATLVIRLRDMSRDEALHNGLAEIAGGHNFFSPGPVYTLTDARRQRNEARLQALAAARAEAEDYAAALGMRVARMVRVTDRVGPDLLSVIMSESGREAAASLRETNGPDVVTVMPIGVDFVLAPR